MKVAMRPTGRIVFSCIRIGLYQGYYGVHEKKMRSLFMHGELLSRRKQVARQKENDQGACQTGKSARVQERRRER